MAYFGPKSDFFSDLALTNWLLCQVIVTYLYFGPKKKKIED
jgi:hypothetical protein